MKVSIGAPAMELMRKARAAQYNYADPNVYDYPVKSGVVLIRRVEKECLYIKTSGTRNSLAIALQGRPEEFAKHRVEIERRFRESRILDWEEIKEMVTWAPNVPTCD